MRMLHLWYDVCNDTANLMSIQTSFPLKFGNWQHLWPCQGPPRSILFHFVLEYLHWGSIIQVVCLQNQSYANSLHIVHRSPEAWIFNKFSVHSSGRYIFIFSLKYMCLRQNWQQIISFWVISVRISSTSMFKSWEWFGHDF